MRRRLEQPSVIYDLDEAVYHADELCPEQSLSSTMAKTILQPAGPARLREVMVYGAPRKPQFDFGSAAHSRILGRGQEVVAIDGDRRTKDVKNAIADAEAEGKLVLKPVEVDAIDRMSEAILDHPLAAELLTAGAGKPEVSMFGIDERTGRWGRGRIDFLHSRSVVVDYKTTRSVDDRPFERSAWDFGYYTQAAHYIRLGQQLDLLDDDVTWLLVAQEKTAPYLVRVFQFDPAYLDYGHEQVRRAFDLWDRCLTTGEWPGYDPSPTTLTAPSWALDQLLATEANAVADGIEQYLKEMHS